MEDIYDYYDQEMESELDEEDLVDMTEMRDEMSMVELYDQCVEPTIFSASDQLVFLFIAAFIFRLTTQLVTIPRAMCNLVSILSGLLALFSVVGVTAVYTTILAMSTYTCLVLCGHRRTAGTYRLITAFFMAYLVFREYFILLPESWEQVRGVQMIVVMKTLSVCYEIVVGSMTTVPSAIEYLGYVFCPATLLFGPWTPMSQYTRLFEKRTWTFTWVVKVLATSTFAFLCLGVSSCWSYWVFLGISSPWILAVRDAISVRFSHYFIALISETTSILCGFYSDDGSMNVEVSKPWKIEVPRSLVDVVVYWNMPIHQWLKIHIFRPSAHLGSFVSIILTFLVSSLLHGMNFGLTLVLLSLGLYSYIEYSIREKLASIFDACIRSRSCSSSCEHMYKSTHYCVMLANTFFGIYAYFHLAYLGIMLDKPSKDADSPQVSGLAKIKQDLHRWDELNYASHWVVLTSYLASVVI